MTQNPKSGQFIKARTQLLNLGFNYTHDKNNFLNHQFRIRFVELNGQKIIQVAVEKNFDRWANSVNFQINLDCPQLNLKNSFMHIRKIVKAKVFNWNKYIPHIEIHPFSQDWNTVQRIKCQKKP